MKKFIRKKLEDVVVLYENLEVALISFSTILNETKYLHVGSSSFNTICVGVWK